MRQNLIGQPPGIDRACAQTGFDVGVRFVEDHRIWARGADHPQQIGVGFHRACAAQDRGVVFDLAGHQDPVARQEVGAGAAEVVL